MKGFRRSTLMAGLGLCFLNTAVAADLAPSTDLNSNCEGHVQFIGLANLLRHRGLPPNCGSLMQKKRQSVEKHKGKEDVMEQPFSPSGSQMETKVSVGVSVGQEPVPYRSVSDLEKQLQEAKSQIQELQEQIHMLEQSRHEMSESTCVGANQVLYKQLKELESTLEMYRRFSPESVIELASRSARDIFTNIYADIPDSPAKNELISRSSEIFQRDFLCYLGYCKEVGNDAALVSDFCQSYGINVVDDLVKLLDSIRKGSTILKFKGKLKGKVRSCEIPEKFEEYCKNNVVQRNCGYESPYARIKELENEVDQLNHEILDLHQKLKKDNDLADQRERQSKESYGALQRKYEEAKRINDTAKEAIKKSEDLKRQLEHLWSDYKELDIKLAQNHWTSLGKATHHSQPQISASTHSEIPTGIPVNLTEDSAAFEDLVKENSALKTRIKELENKIENLKKS